ncbi:MAG: two-component regulator propeller domain-containing protein [Candidatus Pedobacter colombiensis]|uniref:histidine kinase n=1 Tax=Candidatus Pedobacter colombiensis TaxID=3121371 RepID=A0AAJ5W7C9_9SPHI|nr:two-component regulator propeller domain-containing protein [Pedobacter sp.]WEK18493.1 MAG: two-component regulator propeller domain-containing protein [Pedobacter sp.]
MTLKGKELYWFILLLFLAVSSRAQVKCKIEHYSTEDGLSHDGVRVIMKDRDGFMWFGTWDGINRFDGQNFVTYKTRPGDSSNLKLNRIDNIVEDHEGYLWLEVYDNQVYRFDKRNKKFLSVANILAEKKINNILFNGIVVAENGYICLTTINQDVFVVKSTNGGKLEINRYGSDLAQDFQLPSNRINFLHTDQQQHLWIGTENGLGLLHLDQSGTYRSSLPNVGFVKAGAYTCIAEDKLHIWIGTNDGYLIRYDKSSRQFSKQKISQNRLNEMQIARSGKHIYITSTNTVITADLSGRSISKATMSDAGLMRSIYEDKSGLLWIEPEKNGLIKYAPLKNTFKYFFQENDANFFNSAKDYKVFEDHTGRVWMSMKGGGFGYYNPVTDVVEYFYNKPRSSDHKFSNIVGNSYFDPAGILWLSTRDRGVEKIIFQKNDFKHQLLAENTSNKSDNEVRGVYSDRNKRLWISVKSGRLHVYEQGKQLKNIFINAPSGGFGLIYTFLEDRNGVMWLGTKGNGLFRAVPTDKAALKYKLTHYRADKKDINSLSSDLIYALLEDKAGRIWVATYEHGINLIRDAGERVHFVNGFNSFKNYPSGSLKVRHLAEDKAGHILLATTNGLVIFNPDGKKTNDYIFRTYGKIPGDHESLGNNDVQYIYRDTKNRIWLATSGGGLNKVIALSDRGLKVKVFTKESGLPSDYVLSIVEDNAHDLWLGTENGISRLNPEHQRFRNYDSYDGLPATGLSEAAGLKLPNGDLFFGCINGYITFNPAAVTDQKISAKMALTNFQINNKEISPNEKRPNLNIDINEVKAIDLKYNENIISIDFTVLDYRSSNKPEYAYRLNGFDTEWQSVKKQHRATYTNLPPGNYMFEVKSTNSDLYKSIPVKTLAINIAPPPWRTVWAYILYVVLFGILIGVARRITFTVISLRNKIALEQRLTELKLNFFTNISHELRTPLALIVNPIEEISQQENLSVKGQEYIHVVKRNANRMVRFINQLLYFRKTQSGKMNLKVSYTDIIGLVNHIVGYFSELAREKQVELLVNAKFKELYAWVDTEKIDIVIYNLLANALKFTAKNTEVKIEIDHDPVQCLFTLQIMDQGPGVPNDKLKDIFELYYELDKDPGNNLEGTGIGLAICKEIVGLHHGRIEAYNNPDRGLSVMVTLKSGKEHFKNGENIVDGISDHIKTSFLKPMTAGPVISHSVNQGDVNRPVVLVVDDNGELRKFLADQLNEFYQVLEASDGQQGLNMALKLIPDLILSDVMMPVMDGIQMLDHLKINESTSHIPVILLTAKSSVENQIEGLRYGADYYITKPFQTAFILASIENLLKQRQKIFESLLANKKTIELSPGEIFITSKDEVFLKDIIEIVEKGMIDPDFSIELVAESIGMGRTTFYKKFKSLTNMAPIEFVRQMRLKRAKQLLDTGEHNISEIAYAVGFNNAKYFSRCFKEDYGISPSEYLKGNKNINKTVKIGLKSGINA